MAVAYRSHSYINYAVRTNTTVTAPSGITNGDILVMECHAAGDSMPGTPTFPGGWSTLMGPVVLDLGDWFVVRYLLWKVCSGESGNYTITHSSARTTVYMVCVSGGDTGTAPQWTDNAGTGTTSTALSITSTAAGSFICYIDHAWEYYGSASPPGGTTPTFTERLDPSDSVLYAADGIYAAGGATGNKSHTNSNVGSTHWAALLVAIGPPAVAGQPYRKRTGGIPHMRLSGHSTW